jgi:uncharacterized lipoprotein YajG
MKHLIIILLACFAFAACTTKETTKETTIETVKEPVAPAPAPAPVPAPEKNNKFEMELSDTGSSIKIKLP